MDTCKMMLIGRDRDVQFFCERCAVGESVEVRSHKGRVSRKIRAKQPGVCVSCCGSGFEETSSRDVKKCKECSGSGVCPECNGEYSKSWHDLSLTAQSKVISRLEHGEDLVAGYEIVHGLYKTYL